MMTKGIAVFLILSFGIAWVLWEAPAWFGVVAELRSFAVFAGTFAPAIAAVVVRRFVTHEGFADAGLGLRAENWPYYAASLLIPLLAVAVVALVAPALGLGRADYALAPAKTMVLPASAPNALGVVVQLSLFAVLGTPILWGEEFGWRSYLQLRLFANRPFLAAVATGIIWGVWHFPLLLQSPELPLHPALTLVLFPIGTILYSVVFGWIRSRSGSIWAASFAHSAVNNVRSPLVAMLFASEHDMLPVALLGLGAYALVAGAIVAGGGLKRR